MGEYESDAPLEFPITYQPVLLGAMRLTRIKSQLLCQLS